jgi:ABC-type bacteriocin/lantibiotic exporter with double-glycine peptidase domain
LKKAVKIKQRDITDCGAACLASVAAHYRLGLPVSLVRQYAGTDKYGTNISGLLGAAEKLGFQAKGARGPLESLAKIPLPAIAHVILKNGLHHFVVIYRVTTGRITIMDPGDGCICRKKFPVFAAEWTGIIVLLLPHTDFVAGNRKQSNQARFRELLRPHGSMMLQALTGALVYTLLGLSTSIYMQKIIDFVLTDGNTRLLNLLSIAMILVLIFQSFIGAFKTLIGLRTGQQIDARLILGYYKHLLQLPQRFFDTMRVGEIISRVNDAVKIRVFINDIALTIVCNFYVPLLLEISFIDARHDPPVYPAVLDQ